MSSSPPSTLPSAEALLAWYDRHRRRLPWRAAPGETADPYRVWLSEIMLQQTTVVAVIPYFDRFLALYPTVQDLAAAPEPAVLSAWAGLGYYARARNLHACAKRVAELGGFPRSIAALEALPGIGRYTARAVAAIAFGIPAVPVDGNVERVTARLFHIATPVPAARPELARVADRLGDQPAAQARPADFAQALFDLGATICNGRPACVLCPWHDPCLARQNGDPASYPIRTARPERPVRYGAVFHLMDARGHLLLRQRPPSGLLGGMSELAGTVWRDTPWLSTDALTQAPMAATWILAGTVRHVFTHFVLLLDVYAATVETISAAGSLVGPETMGAHPLPSVMLKCIAAARRGMGSGVH